MYIHTYVVPVRSKIKRPAAPRATQGYSTYMYMCVYLYMCV